MIFQDFIHLFFDILATLLAILASRIVYVWKLKNDLPKTLEKMSEGYFISLGLGSIIGAFLLGSMNLWVSGIPILGRSILGSLTGAICAIELYKNNRNITGSTGYIYVIPFAVVVMIGRIGCLLSGISDQTYGIPTHADWGWDFGDHILRHPVPLYESLNMLGFTIGALFLLKFAPAYFVQYGFYICVGFYAAQRFVLEFFKPYATLWLGLNIFQWACILLCMYCLIMISRTKNVRKIKT